MDHGATWVFLWCDGRASRSTDEPLDEGALAYARSHVIEPAERVRLLAKAQKKHRSRTVVMAERWEDDLGRRLVVFYEGGPYLLEDRAEPDRR
ncbi:hypothetical protein CXY01_32340 [Cellulomonas xylanilytica]|uniref:Uncharacterized protein n=1 Tax=Cellulomonas xylanilytica TaxID=233583 RepID=A0A510V767_9CELL|nr:hypothetical protein CXY01_32340 [Cellulomonas xylanilytica]